jgi:hypothetical protein
MQAERSSLYESRPHLYPGVFHLQYRPITDPTWRIRHIGAVHLRNGDRCAFRLARQGDNAFDSFRLPDHFKQFDVTQNTIIVSVSGVPKTVTRPVIDRRGSINHEDAAFD